MKKNKKDYIFYLDFLRVISILAVILLHVAAQNFREVPLGSLAWNTFNISDSLVRWCVPVLIMISGVFFLDNEKELSLKKLYSKNILRLFIILIFWSFIYGLDEYLKGASIKDAIKVFVQSKYHLWFLNMIIGLYLVTPLLRKITKEKKDIEYFLIISFIFSILMPSLFNFLRFNNNVFIGELITSFKDNYNNINLSFGYVFYFVLGYYLHKYKLNSRIKYSSFFLGILGALVTILLTDLYSRKLGVAKATFYGNFNVGVTLMSVAIFLFVKNIFSKKTNKRYFVKMVKLLSSCSLGMYLIHVYVLDKLNVWGNINTLSFNPIFSIFVVFGLTSFISFIFILCLKQIPVIKKYLV